MPHSANLNSLRIAFLVHAVVDYTVGLPLFFAPAYFADLAGMPEAPIVLLRLVAAALFGIGGISFLVRNEPKKVFVALLRLKLIWSGVAIIALGIALATSPFNLIMTSAFILFILFFLMWTAFLVHR